MAAVQITQTFQGNIAKVFKGIKSYNRYPEFITGVQKIIVSPAKVSGSACQVRYELNVIKTFFYVLDMFEEEPKKIWWTCSESNLMKKSEGSWDFESISKTSTNAVYTLDILFKGFVPSAITDRIAKANLPTMMDGFQKLIDSVK